MEDPFSTVIGRLNDREVRFVLIGVWGANLYARSASELFTTHDRDLFLPADPANLLRAWTGCLEAGFTLWVGNEPLDVPHDALLARAIVDRRALVTAHHDSGLDVDLTLTMAGFRFEDVWKERRLFRIEGREVPVARLTQIVQSKAAAGRDKDRLFLASHAETLKRLLERD